MHQMILLVAFEALLLINYSIQKNKSGSVTGMVGKDRYCEIIVGEAYRLISAQEIMVDIHIREEYDAGHTENAVLLPSESIGSEMPEALHDKEATLLVYCRSGRRSKESAQKLLALGYQNFYNFGSVIDWPYELVKEG